MNFYIRGDGKTEVINVIDTNAFNGAFNSEIDDYLPGCLRIHKSQLPELIEILAAYERHTNDRK